MNREDKIGALVWNRVDSFLWRETRKVVVDNQISTVWMVLLRATGEQVEAISDCIDDALGETLQ